MGHGQSWPGLVQATLRGTIHGGVGLMDLEYKIIYRIGQDIPINPRWIKDQIQDAVDALQEKINEKNLHGTHTLELKAPAGW